MKTPPLKSTRDEHLPPHHLQALKP